MTPQSRLISDTELEILKVLWEEGPGTVRELQAHLDGLGREWAYTTTQTLLNRLRDKGYVQSAKRGRAFVFRPTVSRDQLLGKSLDDLASRVCDGEALPLMLNLVSSSKFTRKELKRFRALLDELEGGKS